MVTSRLDWRIPVQLLTGGCAVLLGAGALIEFAKAQPYVFRPTPLPPPVFNPSTPYVVPQPSYKPIAPTTPTVAPGYVVGTPVDVPRTAGYPHRRTSAAKTSSAKLPAAKTHRVHRSRAVPVGPAAVSYSSTYAPFGYGYGCAWQRSWDGYWFRTSPCS